MTADPGMLDRYSFLGGLDPGQVDRLAAHASPVTFPAGHHVFPDGGVADAFWLIHTGRVNLVTHLPGRGDVVVETIGPGRVLGWSWLIPPYRWHFGAVAVDAVEAVRFDAAAVRALCDEDPVLGYDLTRRFIPVLVDRMQATRLRLLDLYGGAR